MCFKLTRLFCTYRILFFITALLLLGAPLAGRAQSGCLLAPVPLSQRMQQAALVVEARVASQQAERRPGGHIGTRHALNVFKVFKGRLPAGPLQVRTLGGTLGLAREVVSGALVLAPGQQGIFFLVPDPASPGMWQLYAGPQGFIAYDVPSLAASDPFARYPAIEAGLYPALGALAGRPYQVRQPNAWLAAARQRATRPAARGSARPQGTPAPLGATPAISGFSPAAATAGTSTSATTSDAGVLTISGSGFNAAQGSGYVELRDADNPGPDNSPNYVQPLASDYLSWTDTQVQVRVPSQGSSGHTAGTGQLRVTNSDGATATSQSALTVTYALTNLSASTSSTDPEQTYRPHLVDTDGNGGYTLHYSPSFPAAAQAPFTAALAGWHCQAQANRTLGAATTTDATDADNVSVVRFDNASDPLPAGVLGLTYGYYVGCMVGNAIDWELMETDYVFSSTTNWNYASADPSGNQYDFQSVALHELGHGLQLTHIISATGVMNYALANGQTRRALDGSTDLAAARDVTGYSTAASDTERCNLAAYIPSACPQPLPVVLVAFAARYVPGQGTTLAWTTASEQQSAWFVVESQAAPETPWQEVARLPAAGSSATARHYQALDPRPLAGTRYYRLRQLDQDGSAHYAPAVAVQGDGASPAALAAYPNPATGQVYLSGPLAAGAAAQVRLLDALGRVARQASGPAGQAAFELPLAGLPPGLYVLEWDGGAGPRRLRLTVE